VATIAAPLRKLRLERRSMLLLYPGGDPRSVGSDAINFESLALSARAGRPGGKYVFHLQRNIVQIPNEL
jgi:hypothetical protein